MWKKTINQQYEWLILPCARHSVVESLFTLINKNISVRFTALKISDSHKKNLLCSHGKKFRFYVATLA